MFLSNSPLYFCAIKHHQVYKMLLFHYNTRNICSIISLNFTLNSFRKEKKKKFTLSWAIVANNLKVYSKSWAPNSNRSLKLKLGLKEPQWAAINKACP